MRGIGRAIAAQFAAEGANVALIDLDPAVAAVADELADQHSVRTLAIPANVTDFAAMQRPADVIQTSLNRVDHIIFAVGVGSGKFGFPFWNLEPADGAGCWK